MHAAVRGEVLREACAQSSQVMLAAGKISRVRLGNLQLAQFVRFAHSGRPKSCAFDRLLLKC